MADTFKVLAQIIPTLAVLTDAYTAPSQVTVSSIVVCNQSSTEDKFRISIAVAGAVDNSKQYLYYDASISENRVLIVTSGITLGSTDVIRVYSTNGTISFNIFGVEIS